MMRLKNLETFFIGHQNNKFFKYKKEMSLEGKKIVFTGFRDAKLQELIKEKGGNVISTMSGVTSILITEGEKSKKSEKLKKAEKMGIEILPKSEFVKKYLEGKPKKGFLEYIFGKSDDKKESTKKTKLDTDPAYTVKKDVSFLIHDNGGRPFQVNLTKTTYSVYRQSKVLEQGKNWAVYTGPYDKAVIKPTSYLNVYVGRDPNYGKKFEGNSILVRITPRTFVFIGQEIIKFSINDTIVGYKSPVYGSDVAYPYAMGAKNTYLFIENTYIPNELLTDPDPYTQLYELDDKTQNAHKKKYKMSGSIIQKRV